MWSQAGVTSPNHLIRFVLLRESTNLHVCERVCVCVSVCVCARAGVCVCVCCPVHLSSVGKTLNRISQICILCVPFCDTAAQKEDTEE